MKHSRLAQQYLAHNSSETIQLPANDPEVIRYLQQSKSASTGAAPAEVTTLAVEKPPLPQAKPPPRRKPRQSLESMSAALEKGKKMTTLEKVSPPCYVLVPVY